MDIYHMDYESYSEADLRKYGSYRYASDPSAKILLCAICKNDGPVELWDYSNPAGNGKALALLQEAAASPDALLFAHNINFEAALNFYLWEKTFGCPAPDLGKLRCTAAAARVAAIPSSLEKAAEFLKLPIRKDKIGSVLIQKFCLPGKDGRLDPTTDKFITVAGEKMTVSAAWALFREYCRTDVEVERQIHNRLKSLDLTGIQLRSFVSDLRTNQIGIPVNIPGIIEAEKIIADYNQKAGDRFREITNLNPGQTGKVLAWLKERGYPKDDLRVGSVSDTLEEEDDEDEADTEGMTPEAVEALRLRSLLSFAALKKLPTMRLAACPDSTIKGAILWHGASRTGRASGRICQPQNFRRSTIGDLTHDVYRDICSGTSSADEIEMLYAPTLEAIASSVRHFIDPGPGRQFLSVDFSAIEARTRSYLANHESMLQAFRDGRKLYESTASLMLKIPYADINPEQRFVGKVCELALGYQGGVGAFVTMAQNLGVHTPEDEAEAMVKLYRKSNPELVNFWYEMQRCAVAAIRSPGNWMRVNDKVRIGVTGTLGYREMLIELPSKHRLHYPEPRVTDSFSMNREDYIAGRKVSDEDISEKKKWVTIPAEKAFDADGSLLPGVRRRDAISYYGQIKGSAQWGRVFTYGGSLCENVSQSLAGNFLTHGVLSAEAKGYQLCFPVHDEGNFHFEPEKGQSAEELTELFCALPPWAGDFPLEAVCKVCKYYQK